MNLVIAAQMNKVAQCHLFSSRKLFPENRRNAAKWTFCQTSSEMLFTFNKERYRWFLYARLHLPKNGLYKWGGEWGSWLEMFYILTIILKGRATDTNCLILNLFSSLGLKAQWIFFSDYTLSLVFRSVCKFSHFHLLCKMNSRVFVEIYSNERSCLSPRRSNSENTLTTFLEISRTIFANLNNFGTRHHCVKGIQVC